MHYTRGYALDNLVEVRLVLEHLFLFGVADEVDVDQDGRHLGTHEDIERRAFDAVAPDAVEFLPEPGNEVVLHDCSEPCRVVGLGGLYEVVQYELQIAHRPGRSGVLTGRYPSGLFVVGQVQYVGLYAGCGPSWGRINVYGDEKVGVLAVGYCGPFLKRDKDIRVPGEYYLRPCVLCQLFPEHPGELQGNIFFLEPVFSYCAGVFSAVARVYDNRVHLQPELLDKGCVRRKGRGRGLSFLRGFLAGTGPYGLGRGRGSFLFSGYIYYYPVRV